MGEFISGKTKKMNAQFEKVNNPSNRFFYNGLLGLVIFKLFCLHYNENYFVESCDLIEK